VEDFNTPVRWDIEKSQNLRWKIKIPGLGHSSPAIWDDRIFVTTAVKDEGQARLKVGLYGDVKSEKEENNFSWRLYCIDKTSGRILWHRESHIGKPGVKRHPKSSHANPTPCTNGKYVVAFFGSEGMYCYDMEGKLVAFRPMGWRQFTHHP
jgi:outer membrane protein assembly factor BamB